MKCKLCGGKSHRYVKIKNGSICEECYNKMPMLIAINCGSLTSSEITSAYRIMKEITDEEIKWYVNNEEKIFKCCGFVPLGKASLFIDKVEGDYNTMLGISPSIVYNKLKEQKI